MTLDDLASATRADRTLAVFDSAGAFIHTSGSHCFRFASKLEGYCMQTGCSRPIAIGDAVLGFPPGSHTVHGRRWLIYCERCARRLPLRALRGRWSRQEEYDFYSRMVDRLMDDKRLSAKQQVVFDRLLDREVEESERRAASRPPVDETINAFLAPRRPAVPCANTTRVAEITTSRSTKKARKAA